MNQMLKTITKLTPLIAVEAFESFLLKEYPLAKKFLTTVNPELLEEISKKKALHMFKIAAKETPAYQMFLQQQKINPEKVNSIKEFDEAVPSIDKNNYIKKFSFEQRCKEGHLPTHGNIDESGGTSGKATNWIHDFSEETPLFKAINFEYNYVFEGSKKNYFVLSAWSTGPWATGIKFCEMMERISLVKNTSTDAKDLIETIKMFGKEKNYLVSGYPPFVKNLIDDYSELINWKEYNIDIITGGEGVPIEWVYYLKKKLRPGAKIVSSYGASDIDIGVGFESPLCFFIRELAYKNEKMRLELFGKDEIPMIFQYNPLVHYIRPCINAEGKPEFEITLLDRHVAMPKIKYNLHDEGKRFSYKQLIELIIKYEPQLLLKFVKKGGKKEDILHLPFLCIFGRSDGTLSFDGANVFPDQIEGGILKDKRLAKVSNRFKLEKKYDKNHTVEFHIHVELKKNVKAGKGIKNNLIIKEGNQRMKEKYVECILKELLAVNPDFRESYSKNKKLKPFINLYQFEHPFFQQDDTKVKNIYFKK